MRVCIVGELVGGVGVYTQNLIRGLMNLGIETTTITPHPNEATRGRVIAVRPTKGRGRWIPHAFRFARALRRCNEPYDVVHFTDARFAVFVGNPRGPLLGTMNDYFYTATGWFRSTGTKALYDDWMSRHLYYNLVRTLESRCRGMHFTPGYPISCGRLIRLPRTCWTISE